MRLILFVLLMFVKEALFANTYTCSNTSDAGAGSLRQAVLDANAHAGSDLINFSISGAITLTSGTLSVTDPVTIDGETAASWASGTPTLRVDGNNSSTVNVIEFNAGSSGSIIKSIILTGGKYGISISGTNTITVYGCIIGSNNVDADLHNNSGGIYITNSNTINIGSNLTNLSQRNIISKNTTQGIFVDNAGGACFNITIAGNYIGLNKAGTAANGNLTGGIYLNHCSLTTIGGKATTNRNIISGNGAGTVDTENGIYGNTVTTTNIKGNYIGLSATGTAAIKNYPHGIHFESNCTNDTIGGKTVAERNVISGNNENGIWLLTSCTNNAILGNYIGTNAAGTTGIANGTSAIAIEGSSNNNTIGGIIAGYGNILSGNGNNGIWVNGCNNTKILGNTIGLDVNGAALGNTQQGIYLMNNSTSNTIGFQLNSFAAGEANTIAYNGYDGIRNESDKYNAFRGNKVYCNAGTGGGYGLNVSNNESISPPSITSSTGNVVSGTSGNNNYIHVYWNSTKGAGCDCQGETYLGTTTADGSGNWSFTHNKGYSAGQSTGVTATQTNSNNSTSAYYHCSSTALPIELLSFIGKIISDGYTVIEWSTASETNNDHFEILRSVDGINWEEIGHMNGAGTTTLMQNYQFKDLMPLIGINYYKLKQVDFDGKSKDSQLLALKYETIGFDYKMSLNSANDILVFHFIDSTKQDYMIQLYNTLGVLILYHQVIGETNISLPVFHLAKGMYFVNIYSLSSIQMTARKYISKKIIVN